MKSKRVLILRKAYKRIEKQCTKFDRIWKSKTKFLPEYKILDEVVRRLKYG